MSDMEIRSKCSHLSLTQARKLQMGMAKLFEPVQITTDTMMKKSIPNSISTGLPSLGMFF